MTDCVYLSDKKKTSRVQYRRCHKCVEVCQEVCSGQLCQRQLKDPRVSEEKYCRSQVQEGCLCSTTSVFHHVCVLPCLCSTVSVLHRVYVPPCLGYSVSMLHRVHVPSCLCSSVFMFHHVYVPPCLYSTVSLFHDDYIPPCLCSTMSMFHRVQGGSMFLRVYVPPREGQRSLIRIGSW